MEVQDDVHTVLLDRVVCDLLEVLLLVARVVSGAWNLDPSCVRSRDANEIHTTRRELVNIFGGDICRVALLKHRVALVAKFDAAIPLVDGTSAVLIPPVWVNVSFLGQPSSKVDAVGMEVPPIDIITLSS